jgi:salicylate hydroxylase
VAARIPLLIAGGGIGGLATALAAAQSGRPVHVLERSAEFTELGAGLQLAPNASRVLDQLGLLPEVHRRAFFPRRLILMDMLEGTEITAVALDQHFRDRYGFPYIVMHRADLLEVEVAACRAHPLITLETSKEVAAIREIADGLHVQCSDGSQYECDALIGADGLHSQVRKFVIGDQAPVCSEYVAYRGTAPMELVPPGDHLDSMTIWIGPEKHFVQYPLRQGEICNQVLVFRSHRYSPDSDDWGSVEEMDQQYAEACPYVRSAVELIHRNRRWPMYDRLPDPRWQRGRAVLLGDAAHPMLQYVAQGACQALEDSATLGRELAAHGPAVEAAFAAYQSVRYPRSAFVQTLARQFGELKHGLGNAARIRQALQGEPPYRWLDPLYLI